MARIKKESPESKKRKTAPASTPEGRQAQIVAAAVDLAEQRILEGTASNQLLLHYIKIADPMRKIEEEILEKQKELIVAKTESLASQKKMEELYAEAIKAMTRYSGAPQQLEEEYEDLQ